MAILIPTIESGLTYVMYGHEPGNRRCYDAMIAQSRFMLKMEDYGSENGGGQAKIRRK